MAKMKIAALLIRIQDKRVTDTNSRQWHTHNHIHLSCSKEQCIKTVIEQYLENNAITF